MIFSTNNIILLCVVFLKFTIPIRAWEFAVTTSEKIVFFDKHWKEITSAAHQFEDITAIALDEAAEQIYFSDHKHNNGSIFMLTLSRDELDYHLVEKIIPRTANEYIQGIAFDPLSRTVYWTDATSLRIYRMKLNDPNKNYSLVLDLSNEKLEPDSLAIDVCRQKLYWTTAQIKNATIETSTLDGNDRRTLVKENLSFPRGIIVDQYTKRIFWANKLGGSHFSIESATLDGEDRRTVLSGLNQYPNNLAINKDLIYWTDTIHSAVWSVPKNATNSKTAKKILELSDKPRGIVTRSELLKLENFPPCSKVVKRIKKGIASPFNTNKPMKMSCPRAPLCLNDGILNPETGNCLCTPGFSGENCEIEECLNYCVHGTCVITILNELKCECNEGYTGARCDREICSNFCLNNGTCLIEKDHPICECGTEFTGSRCEKNITELCLVFCKFGGYDNEWNLGSACSHMCDVNADLDELTLHHTLYDNGEFQNRTTETLLPCSGKLNTLEISIICGSIVLSFALAFLIVRALKLYKPARPRIKKTFFVQKQTPLTCRPITTEQCQITIEDCCNMNVCDTPCFDPSLLQQSMSFANCTKEEDKLINEEDSS